MGTGLDHGCWDGQVPAYLARGYRVLVFDNRGTGRSATAGQRGGRLTMALMAADTAGLLDALGLAQVGLALDVKAM
jgi:pimeloyl-ACP methyl ester carboxylesterase